MSRAAGAMFEQEHLRFLNVVPAVGSSGACGGILKYSKGIIRAVSGDRSLVRQWHQEASGDVWNILIDRAKLEAYDKIKKAPTWQ